MFIKVWFFIFTILTVASCKTPKVNFDPITSQKEYITFGNGGGFTGQVTQYFLANDGQVFVKNGDNYEKVVKISNQNTQQLFANYTTLGLDKLTINNPGNRYYFVGQKNKNLDHKITWGKDALNQPNLEKYYAILMNTIQKIK